MGCLSQSPGERRDTYHRCKDLAAQVADLLGHPFSRTGDPAPLAYFLEAALDEGGLDTWRVHLTPKPHHPSDT
jgi:hypothetical protein